MRKKILTLVSFMVFATYGFSQIEVKINPIGLLFGQIPLSAEYIINDNMGAEITAGYYFKSFGDFTETTNSSGFVTNVLFKYYFKPEDGGDKFYVFPYYRYVSRSWTFTDVTLGEINGTYKSSGIGFGAGYKIVAESGLLFDFGLGVGKNFSSKYSYSDPTYENDISIPINILGRISIGYRF